LFLCVLQQRRSDGTVILQAQGTPGKSFDIEASAGLLHWLDLGSVLADTNGLMQFDDTNAPAYPARFYYTIPQCLVILFILFILSKLRALPALRG